MGCFGLKQHMILWMSARQGVVLMDKERLLSLLLMWLDFHEGLVMHTAIGRSLE